MKKEEFIQKLNTMDAEMEAELREMLDEEMKKPVKKRDAAMIAELTGAITEICGFSTENICNDESISKISGKVTETGRRRKSISVRRISAIAACAALLFGLNQASLNAYGENVFKRAYHFTKGGVSIMIGENNDTEPTEPPTAPPATGAAAPEEEVIELPTYPGDPYGIKAVCAKYGIYPLTPTYIPEGFKLVEEIEDDTGHCTDLIFRYEKEDAKVIVCYTVYNKDDVSVGIPMDSSNIQETNINGKVFTVIKEDNQLKSFYTEDRLWCSFFTFNVDYSEANRVLYSFN
jgi:hypothetical protein